jgi:hypothetical protein
MGIKFTLKLEDSKTENYCHHKISGIEKDEAFKI